MTKHSRLTVKGQVTIPKNVRDRLGLKPGDPVAFVTEGDHIAVRKGEADAKAEQEWNDDFDARLKRAQALAIPLTDMTTDEYMAMIREPVPVPDPE